MNTTLMLQHGGYALALVMIVAAFWRGARLVHATNTRGSVIAGKVTGNVNLSYTESAAPSGTDVSPSPPRDYVSWCIGITGVVVAAAQLVHDVLK